MTDTKHPRPRPRPLRAPSGAGATVTGRAGASRETLIRRTEALLLTPVLRIRETPILLCEDEGFRWEWRGLGLRAGVRSAAPPRRPVPSGSTMEELLIDPRPDEDLRWSRFAAEVLLGL